MGRIRRIGRKLRGGPGRGPEGGPGLLPVDVSGLAVAPGVSLPHLRRRGRDVPVLRYPPTVPARTLDLPYDQLVLGAARGGEARAYPTSVLRHIVNDQLGGGSFLVTYCVWCSSGLAFDPLVEGQTLTFDVFGAYQGAFVMNDEQTGTIWAHLTGEALVGPLAGRRLLQEPVQMTTLRRWLELHPDSTAPDPSIAIPKERPGVRDQAPRQLLETVSTWDDRLSPRSLVLGVRGGGRLGRTRWIQTALDPL